MLSDARSAKVPIQSFLFAAKTQAQAYLRLNSARVSPIAAGRTSIAVAEGSCDPSTDIRITSMALLKAILGLALVSAHTQEIDLVTGSERVAPDDDRSLFASSANFDGPIGGEREDCVNMVSHVGFCPKESAGWDPSLYWEEPNDGNICWTTIGPVESPAVKSVFAGTAENTAR